MKSYFCGFNGFQQFGSTHAKKVAKPTEFNAPWSGEYDHYALSWAFNVFTKGKDVTLSGFLEETPNTERSFNFDSDVQEIAVNDNFVLILLKGGNLFRISIRKCLVEELMFMSIDRPQKRNVFAEVMDPNKKDTIEKIACGRSICIAITKNNAVYNMPSKIFEFPEDVKIESVCCGFEHALALTGNGDIYAWGNGMRGQLGLTELQVAEVPTLVEPLAGIKITTISAGGWNSAAISSFGDVYLWGSNSNGQLGTPVYKKYTSEAGENITRKNPSVFHLPQIAKLPRCCVSEAGEDSEGSCSVVDVNCGARHIMIKKSCKKIFCSGWNEHGQLGLDSKANFVDKFTELKMFSSEDIEFLCGQWCTLFINKS